MLEKCISSCVTFLVKITISNLIWEKKKIVHRLYELHISTELPNPLQGNPDSFEVSRKILIAVSNTCISLQFC